STAGVAFSHRLTLTGLNSCFSLLVIRFRCITGRSMVRDRQRDLYQKRFTQDVSDRERDVRKRWRATDAARRSAFDETARYNTLRSTKHAKNFRARACVPLGRVGTAGISSPLLAESADAS